LLRQLGKTEIENFDAAIFGDEDIFWLQVSVNDALDVCRGEAARDLGAIVNGAARGKRPGTHNLAKRLPFQEFRDDKGSAFVFTDLVDGKNIRVVERRSALSFLCKPVEPIGIAR
jgi:hypothetical protein